MAGASDEDVASFCQETGITMHQHAAVSSFLDENRKHSRKRGRSEKPLQAYFSAPLSADENTALDGRLLHLMADARLPFALVERASFVELVGSLRQSAIESLPSRRQLSGSVLNRAAEAAMRSSLGAVKALACGEVRATLMVDGYKGHDGRHTLGAVVGVLAKRCVHDIEEEGYQHHGLATAAGVASFLERIDNDVGVLVACVCTDDAGQCGRAKRILALRHPRLIFLRCMAHQLNLLVKHGLRNTSL